MALLPDRLDLAKPLLPPREWSRVQRYMVDDAGMGTDAFGTDGRRLGFAYAVGYWMHRHYFRVVSDGHEHLPQEGAAVVVGNHSGVIPLDGLMLAVDIFHFTDPPRLLRYMVDYFVYSVPFLGVLFRSLGQMPGTRRNFDGMIEQGHMVGIFPEGAEALGKPASKRYELYPFSHGHIELAARHGAPVVPFGIVGAEEQFNMIADLKPLARALRLPYFPVTTTALFPKPVRYFIRYGEPLNIDPGVLSSIEIREREIARVREAVEDLIHAGLAKRREYGQGAV